MQIGGKCLTLVEGTVYNFVSFVFLLEQQFLCYDFLKSQNRIKSLSL